MWAGSDSLVREHLVVSVERMTANRNSSKVDLSGYDNSWYDPGRGKIVRILWYVVNAALFRNRFFTSYRLKRSILRLFGARIGRGVAVKPNVNIKYPWNVAIGDASWIGEDAWLDSLGYINIGNNVCISQGVYVCTGSHDWTDAKFQLIVKGVDIADCAWIGAKAVVLPGTSVGEGVVLAAGSVFSGNSKPYFVYRGNPALEVARRELKT